EITRPFTGQRKLLPDIGSGAGSCSLLARCGAVGPVVSGEAAAWLAGEACLCLDWASAVFAADCDSSSARDVPGGGMVVVFTTCTSGASLGFAGLVSFAA